MASNTLLNPSIITREALVELKNAMVLLDKCDRQLDTEFENKIGDTINVRRRVRYLSGDGADISSTIRDTIEGNIPVVLDKRKHVAIEFSSQELTLDIEEFSKRYIRPAMIELVQQVENEIADQYKNIFFFTGVPGTDPTSLLDVAAPATVLDNAAAPFDGRNGFYTPAASYALADGLKAVFPTQIATRAIERASIGEYVGINVMKCQSLKVHTVGALGGTPVINGASQNVAYADVKDTYEQTLNVDGWTASVADILLAGDVFTIADVYQVNPRTRETVGELQTFTVTADATSNGSGETALTISPPIITSGAYQTVDSAPADGAAITIKTGNAGSQHPQNLIFLENAITVAFAQLEMLANGEGGRESMDNVSIRVQTDSNILTDQNIYRFDILFGVKTQNPYLAVRTTG